MGTARRSLMKSFDPTQLVKMRTLGRPFDIGTLYNYIQDQIIPDTYLWDPEDIGPLIQKQSKKQSIVRTHSSDDHRVKSSDLGLDDHLLISLMADTLTEYRGASSYIDDRYRNNTAAVTLLCRTKVRRERVDPKSVVALDFLCQDRILRQGQATHVVVSIAYGAQSFCVARRSLNSDVSGVESKEDAEEYLKSQFQSWAAGLSTDETFQSDWSIDSVDYTLYSDLERTWSTPSSPDKDAVCYQKCLRVLNVSDADARPLSVWLCPLWAITSKAPNRDGCGQISRGIVQRCQQLRHQLDSVQQMMSEIDAGIQRPPRVSGLLRQVAFFGDAVRRYRKLVDTQLRRIVADVRLGTLDESAIDGVAVLVEKSPLNPGRICNWIATKRNELALIHHLLQTLPIPFETQLSALSSSDRPKTVLLRLAAFSRVDPEETDAIRSYLERHDNLVAWDKPVAPETRLKLTDDIRQEIWGRVTQFSRLALDNRNVPGIDYRVYYDGLDTHLSTPIVQVWSRGSLVRDNVPYPPTPLEVRVSENWRGRIRLIWTCAEPVNAVERFLVEYRTQNAEWTSITTNNAQPNLHLSTLKPLEAYWFRVAAVSVLGRGPFSAQIGPEEIRAVCGPPTDIHLVYATESSLVFQWLEPVTEPDVVITGYEVRFWPKRSDPTGGDVRSVETRGKRCELQQLERDTSYWIQLVTLCGSLGSSSASAPLSATTRSEPEPASWIVRDISEPSNATPIPGLELYDVPLQVETIDEEKRLRRCRFGPATSRMFRRKTILVVGATGAGKTTLINAMVNYVLDVQSEDSFRFRLIGENVTTQAVSQTKWVTTYDLQHIRGSRVPYSLTIVDTPGFGDTSGLWEDRAITEKIRQLFQHPAGVSQLEAVCFVIQSSLARLTPTQRYIYDSILALFGRDVADNIRLIVTGADGGEPPVLAAVRNSKIPYPTDPDGNPLHYKFNSTCFFANPDGDPFTNLFFEMSTDSFQRFFDQLSVMRTTSLRLTREVLNERQRLETITEGLQQRIDHGLAKLEEYGQIQKALADIKLQVQANQDHTFQIEVLEPRETDISGTGHFITNCLKCKYTCHYPCKHLRDEDRRTCHAMDADGRCRVCPARCLWSEHKNTRFRYEWIKKKVVCTRDQIRERYLAALDETASDQQLLEQLLVHLQEEQKAVVELVQAAQPVIERLGRIALLPHPFSAPEYIDLLIKAEEQEHRSGYMDRIDQLRKLRKMADIQSKVAANQPVFELPQQPPS